MILDISFAAVSEFSDRNRAAIIAYVFLAALFTWNLTSYLSSPLRQFPGPLLAGKPQKKHTLL
jgi:hypothetical protein